MGGGIYIVGWVLSWSLSVFEVNNPKKSRMGYREYVRRTKSQGDERGGGVQREIKELRDWVFIIPLSYLLLPNLSLSLSIYLSLHLCGTVPPLTPQSASAFPFILTATSARLVP